MNKPVVWLAIVFVLIVVGVIVYSSLGLQQYRVEVCMAFHGRQVCRTASAATREQARRTATDNACAQLASGMTDSMACTSQPPASVTWQAAN